MTLGGFCAYGVRIVSTHLALYLRVMTRAWVLMCVHSSGAQPSSEVGTWNASALAEMQGQQVRALRQVRLLCVGETCLSAGASVRQVPAAFSGAFRSFCRALPVAPMANVEARSPPFAKHMRRIACTLRIVIFCFDLFVSH